MFNQKPLCFFTDLIQLSDFLFWPNLMRHRIIDLCKAQHNGASITWTKLLYMHMKCHSYALIMNAPAAERIGIDQLHDKQIEPHQYNT